MEDLNPRKKDSNPFQKIKFLTENKAHGLESLTQGIRILKGKTFKCSHGIRILELRIQILKLIKCRSEQLVSPDLRNPFSHNDQFLSPTTIIDNESINTTRASEKYLWKSSKRYVLIETHTHTHTLSLSLRHFRAQFFTF